MKKVYFFTGFPGFISEKLVLELIKNNQNSLHIYLLVLPNLEKKARETLKQLSIKADVSYEIFTLVIGDITKENLSISNEINKSLQETVTHVYHLAAIYDLAVKPAIAEEVNVRGTDNVNQWVLQLSKLQRYTYFSTAYVSGKREGRIFENELTMNQSFKNHYERTKYEAEVLVKEIRSKVPTTIIRPGIVRGDSNTGETSKFDGVYFMLHLIDKFSSYPILPFFGDGQVEGNFVPVDYVVNATVYLSHLPEGIGKTYHLTDPAPYTMKQVYAMLAEEYCGKKPRGTLPTSLANVSLRVKAMRRLLKVQKETLAYFSCQSSYDTRVTQKDLKDSGIQCPSFKKTLPTMVQYYRDHKNDEEKYIKIE